jgi:AraC family transcriptional regulator of adaptative response / DNA-3-methyladenine glycosylase II
LNTTLKYDWTDILEQLQSWAIPGIESVSRSVYRRTILLDGHTGMLAVHPAPSPDKPATSDGAEEGGRPVQMRLRLHLPVWQELLSVVHQVNWMVGLELDDQSGNRLLLGSTLGPLVARRPTLRVAGAWSGFEAIVGAIVTAMHPHEPATALGQLVKTYGDPVVGLPDGLTHTFPTPPTLAEADLASLPVATPAARVLRDVAARATTSQLPLHPGAAYDDLVAAMSAVPDLPSGVIESVALRLGHRDVWPADDPLVQEALTSLSTPTDPDDWRPWRALAATHLRLAALPDGR